MEEILRILYEQTQELEKSISDIAVSAARERSGFGLINENLVKRLTNVKVKMYQEQHKLPHVHLDIGSEKHSASIAISTQALLAGSVDNKYEKTVMDWIGKNKDNLLKIWNNMQQGESIDLSTLN